MNKADQLETALLDDEIFMPEHPYASAILDPVQDDGKLDTSEKLSHPNLVKLFGHCCKDRWPMMKMESLENYLSKKDPANIEPLSCDLRCEIALEVVQSLRFLHSGKDVVYRDLKASNILLDAYPTSLSDFGVTPNNSIAKVNAMDSNEAGDFIALDTSSVLTQSKTDMEIKNSRHELGAFGDKNEVEKALKWWPQLSHLQNNWPNMKIKKESQSNIYLILLLIATLLSTITFLIALKIRGCILEEGYKYISSLNPICQIVIQHPYIIRLVIALNSIAFFLSITLTIILFNELPLRPLLLVSASSMLGAYMCIILGPSKCLLSTS